jgi:hypothetical protein
VVLNGLGFKQFLAMGLKLGKRACLISGHSDNAPQTAGSDPERALMVPDA